MADEASPERPDSAGEARDRFEDAFKRLQARSKRSAELNREGADFDTLTADHAELEMMRREAWRAKKDIVSRYEGATPDHVDTPVGMQDTTTFGRVAAVLGALLLAAVIPMIWLAWSGTRASIDGELRSVSVETVERDSGPGCALQLELALRNNEDVGYRIQSVRAIVDRSPYTLLSNQDMLIPAGTTTTVVQRITEPALEDGTCPADTTRSIGTITVALRPNGGADAPWASVKIRG